MLPARGGKQGVCRAEQRHGRFAGWSKCWMKNMSQGATLSPAQPNRCCWREQRPQREKGVPSSGYQAARLGILESQRGKAPGGTTSLCPLLPVPPPPTSSGFRGHTGGPRSTAGQPIRPAPLHGLVGEPAPRSPAVRRSSPRRGDSSRGSFSGENSCRFGKPSPRAKTNKLEQTTTESLIRPSLASSWIPPITVIGDFTKQAQKRPLQRSFVSAA